MESPEQHELCVQVISHSVKRSFFQAIVETVLLYGCEAWILTPTLERSLNGCYTRMLRAALNIKWWQHVPNSKLYDNLPKVGDKVAAGRRGLEGYCSRHPELPAGKVILWEPTHGYRRRGRQRETFLDTLKKDAGLESIEELRTFMED